MDTNLQEHEWIQKREILPFLSDKKELEEKEIGKIEFFEAGLKNEIKRSDTVDNAVIKIVRMALAAEFGPSFVKSKGVDKMILTIVNGIMSDNVLRKQSLLIIDRFAR
ncbi:hypothetical protein A2526_04830 [candidate division WOR-1 bacterium RIFOXYD2_FULL_36_8]|uniref:Uncharacterized protein n=1 Tax=candidate division WOR-1 bacterium RIFOXYB2_FULL_36_35 TaxID=1802578 RepID=A0A1F4RYV8_UNCSA|nr:MAG: hypothetical protein A2230_07770 [candidate division WOR-1 bacterium RIFOXYA2_FULL_36_21]OGC13376.1 MAG: hypothetical protein A2290_02610 [candidate division WOR-1 bacterium RIFOXYB2_FULL_36_35]OGC21238.1 MAG: hypothetical protein A2282_01790 [candidate division WOR-1 bacterium RIFOXYA12_FULL_36_13]OGC41441.1 MAG: hypothetical protein A2526_04830 [candidate division WOR-1 bacterium RIFOXYD2_FULL_36_8]